MQQSRYLNAVLTVIAVLLGLNLWVGAHQSPAGSALDPSGQAMAIGSTDAGQQRTAMIEALKTLNSKVDAMSSKLTDGTLKVEIKNLPNKD